MIDFFSFYITIAIVTVITGVITFLSAGKLSFMYLVQTIFIGIIWPLFFIECVQDYFKDEMKSD